MVAAWRLLLLSPAAGASLSTTAFSEGGWRCPAFVSRLEPPARRGRVAFRGAMPALPPLSSAAPGASSSSGRAPGPPRLTRTKPPKREKNDATEEKFRYYIREGRRSEIDDIADVLMDSFHPDSRPSVDSYIRRYKYNHLRMCFDVDECDRGLFVACAATASSDSAERIVGFCSVDGRPPDPSCRIEFLTPSTLEGTSPRPYVSDLGVTRPHRRRGLGAMLVGACEEWTRERGCERLYLKVEEKNRGGMGLYSSLGYRRTKLPWDGGLVASEWGTAVLMEKSLKGSSGTDRRKRTWIKNQLWKPMKERVDGYSAKRTGPPL